MATSNGAHQKLTEKKSAEIALQEHLTGLSLSEGAVRPPAPKAPGTSGVPNKVATNIYRVEIPNVTIYRYSIALKATTRNDKEIDLTKRTDSTSVIADRLKNCRQAFPMIFDRYSEFFGADRHAVFTDLQSLLYTLNPLDLSPDATATLEIDVSTASWCNLKTIKMEVRNVREVAQSFNLNDLAATIDPATLERDRSILNFVELAVNQHATFEPSEFLLLNNQLTYLLRGDDYELPEKPLDGGGTLYIAPGVQKSAMAIRGSNSTSAACQIGLMLGVRYTSFYSTHKLLDFIKLHDASKHLYTGFVGGRLNEKQLGYLGSLIRRLSLTVRYPNNNQTRTITMSNFDALNSRERRIEERNQTVEEYFNERYGVLQCPNAHLVRSKYGDHFPPEYIEIADNQIVSDDHMGELSKAKRNEECAIRPDKQQLNNWQAAKAIRLHTSEFSRRAAIQFSGTTMDVESRILPPPRIRYGPEACDHKLVPTDHSEWRFHKFLRPASCEKFAVYALRNPRFPSAQIETQDLRTFVEKFKETAATFGMRMGECVECGTYTLDQVEECLAYCSQNGIRLCLFVTPNNADHVHAQTKLYEQRYNVATQNLQHRTITRIAKGNFPTIGNYVRKTNVKLGGLNSVAECEDPAIMCDLSETLIIATSITHPGPKTKTERIRTRRDNEKPGVLGYAANVGADHNEFIGDFHYIRGYRYEFQSELGGIFKSCVERFRKSRGRAPRKILFYYAGLLEGQHRNVHRFTLPLIRDGIRRANGGGTDIPITLIGVKSNNVHLFPLRPPPNAQKDHEFNVPHGSVVDTTIVHAVLPEFYLMPQSVPTGTASVPSYTIVADDNNYSMDTIERITHLMCYEYQIATCATSLPTPVKVASEYAERGNDIFVARSRTRNPDLPRLPDQSLDLARLSAQLNYAQSQFKDRRITA